MTGGRFNTPLCAFCVTCSGSLHRAAYCSPDFHQQAIKKVIIKTIIRKTCNSQDEVEGDEAGGRPQALHRPLLPRLPLHLHDVRPHAQACHAKIGVSSLCPGSVFFLALAKYKYWFDFEQETFEKGKPSFSYGSPGGCLAGVIIYFKLVSLTKVRWYLIIIIFLSYFLPGSWLPSACCRPGSSWTHFLPGFSLSLSSFLGPTLKSTFNEITSSFNVHFVW